MNSNLANMNEETIQYLQEWISKQPKTRVTFEAYMNFCLYHETYGYYRRPSVKIGKEGDFYTSSSIGTVMGETAADWISSHVRERALGKPILVVEWGGGTGALACHVLDELEAAHPDVYSRLHWTSVESSPFHRSLQEKSLESHAVNGKIRFLTEHEWFDEDQPQQTYAVVLANELLDAFPVHKVRKAKTGLEMAYVGWNEQKCRPSEQWVQLHEASEGEEIRRYINEHRIVLQEGQIAELNLTGEGWLRKLGNWMDRGCAVIIDYGDVSDELYAPHRMQGTLFTYRKHQASSDPYAMPGGQDLTAHVNFSVCASTLRKAGFISAEVMTQREFLVNSGIMSKLQDGAYGDPFSAAARKNRSIRQLLLSDGMSEIFKVLIAEK